ncbi:Phosphoribosyl-dephospho-CoA transferase [Caballeronia glathei]|uniref:Phosphoribosyl-dephospho-CoA transferase n=1 Tax=Caballeronia glathei TaxID=60547 RepID=A0A069PRX2_9BURK|nr:malonate decarboxylase holo-ACP synthase [Caballeronia glathei]KDR43360.1 phosphoribosyl-dephospho-CoA transferase [Caballeronia glathei]CDY78731.1 Phosphoribosyl-dephospho-CoA transferase [Caballeronia glathei]
MKPHDLLRLRTDTPPFAGAPAWVAAALARAPYVVVRRARREGDTIAVGVRGRARNERFGAWLDPRHAAEVIAPEDLRHAAPRAGHDDHGARHERAALPAFELLRAIAPLLDAGGHAWGPSGSAGFELASGVETVTPTSDLDLVLRAPAPLSREEAAALFEALSSAARDAGTRVDVQVETRDGAFSLAEFARSTPRVMLRCADGPRLVADPWDAERTA